jgi:hypothetical protein
MIWFAGNMDSTNILPVDHITGTLKEAQQRAGIFI